MIVVWGRDIVAKTNQEDGLLSSSPSWLSQLGPAASVRTYETNKAEIRHETGPRRSNPQRRRVHSFVARWAAGVLRPDKNPASGVGSQWSLWRVTQVTFGHCRAPFSAQPGSRAVTTVGALWVKMCILRLQNRLTMQHRRQGVPFQRVIVLAALVSSMTLRIPSVQIPSSFSNRTMIFRTSIPTRPPWVPLPKPMRSSLCARKSVS